MTTHTPEPCIEPAVCSNRSDRLLLDLQHPALTAPATGNHEVLLDQFLTLLATIAYRIASEPSTDVQSAISNQAA